MSADATGFVYRHSPYSGATFACHAAIADSVNDQHGNELWMAVTKLAVKARCGRQAASRAIARLEDEGWLVLLGQRSKGGKPSRYLFLFRESAVVYESRRTVATGDSRSVATVSPGDSEPSPQATDPPAEPSPQATGTQGSTTQEGTQVPPPPPQGGELSLVHSSPATMSRGTQIEAVWAAWLDATGKDRRRTQLTGKRRKLITVALTAYPLADVIAAVQGWRFSDHHNGEKDGQVWNDIELLLRDAEHIERFRDWATDGRRTNGQVARSSGNATMAAAARYLEVRR